MKASYNTALADRVREALAGAGALEEKTMFGGLCFMLNGKMCICVRGDELMCRIGAAAAEAAVEERGVRPMINKGRGMKDFVYISMDELRTQRQLDDWTQAALRFNEMAKASWKK